MIESKTLGSAVGIQYQGVIDKSEGTDLPSLANGVIVGKFKRGRMDKPFKVTAANYQALLGRDPSNPSYLAVEDAFKRGVSEVSILRVGKTGGGELPLSCTPTDLEFSHYLLSGDNPPSFDDGAHGRFRTDSGAWVDYESAGGHWREILSEFIGKIPIVDSSYKRSSQALPFHFVPDEWTGGYLAGSPDIDRESFEYERPNEGGWGAVIPKNSVADIKPATIEFATSSGRGVDIVAVMLGGSKTATACAYSNWGDVVPEYTG